MNAPLSFRSRSGMVLMEVMFALSIFAVAAMALIIALDSTFDAAADRTRIDLAIRGLENQITLLHSGRLQVSEQDMPDDGTGILYHVAITQEQMKDQKGQQVPNMYRVTVTAKWHAHGVDDQREVSELIYQP